MIEWTEYNHFSGFQIGRKTFRVSVNVWQTDDGKFTAHANGPVILNGDGSVKFFDGREEAKAAALEKVYHELDEAHRAVKAELTKV